MRRWFEWLFVSILTAIPFVISLCAYNLSPSLPIHPILTLWQQFLPIFLLSLAVGISAAFVLFVPAYLQDWPLDVRLVFLTLLAFLTFIILWIAIMLAYISFSLPTPDTMAVAPSWVFYIGGAATLVLIFGILYWADQLYLRSRHHDS